MADGGGHGGASENAAVGRFNEVIHENKEHGKPSAPRRGRRLYFRKGLSNPIPESHLVRPEKISHRKAEIFSGFLRFSSTCEASAAFLEIRKIVKIKRYHLPKTTDRRDLNYRPPIFSKL